MPASPSSTAGVAAAGTMALGDRGVDDVAKVLDRRASKYSWVNTALTANTKAHFTCTWKQTHYTVTLRRRY